METDTRYSPGNNAGTGDLRIFKWEAVILMLASKWQLCHTHIFSFAGKNNVIFADAFPSSSPFQVTVPHHPPYSPPLSWLLSQRRWWKPDATECSQGAQTPLNNGGLMRPVSLDAQVQMPSCGPHDRCLPIILVSSVLCSVPWFLQPSPTRGLSCCPLGAKSWVFYWK